ncbi:MAG: RNA polymerase sigma factor [Spirochaetes bacterium]|nr:RNA polymerase sigma factor [Spirochaetota bacterium]
MNFKLTKEKEILIAKGMMDGDKKSYTEFVELFSPVIYRECMKFSDDSDDADDHLNEILIRVVITIGRFDSEKGSMYTWVITLSRNYLKNNYLKKQDEPELVCYEQDALELYVKRPFVAEDVSTDNDEDGENIPDLIKLRKALAVMSKRDRSILFFRADGFSYENIGDFLGIKSGTAMTAYSRAVSKIKKMFENSDAVQCC